MHTKDTQTMADGIVLVTHHWAHPDPAATVLLVHGVGEHTGRWEHVAEFMVAEGFEVFGFDLRAHGESGDGVLHIEDFDHFVSDVAEVMAAVRSPGRPAVLYGHSMGGLIATMYGKSSNPQPDLIVLSAPALVATVPAPLRFAANVIGRIAPRFAIKSPVEKGHLSRDPQVGEDYVNDPLVYLKGTAGFGKEFFSAMARSGERLEHITTPALVIHGADDEIVPPRASAPLAALDNVERRVFPGLRHEMHNEPESEEVLRFVVGWIKDQLSAA